MPLDNVNIWSLKVCIACMRETAVLVHKQKNHAPHTLENQAKSLNVHQEAESFPSPNW